MTKFELAYNIVSTIKNSQLIEDIDSETFSHLVNIVENELVFSEKNDDDAGDEAFI